jgi:phosphonate transport system substrate-binding protein
VKILLEQKVNYQKNIRGGWSIIMISSAIIFLVFCLGTSASSGLKAQDSPDKEGPEKTPRIQPQPDWPKNLVIGFIPSLGAEQTAKKWEPLIEHLQEQLQVEVDTRVPDSYIRLIAALKTKQVDFVYFGPQSYIQAHRLADAEAIAMELDQEGNPGYRAVIVSLKERNIQTLAEAQGKIMAFTDPDSTSGYLVPLIYFIRDRKQTPVSFASRIVFAGSHAAVIKGVAEGKYDIGATNDMDLVRSCTSLGLDTSRFNVLWKSQLIPGSPFAARKDLPESLKKAFLQALLSMNNDQEALDKMQIGGFEKADDKDFDLIRELEKLKRR